MIRCSLQPARRSDEVDAQHGDVGQRLRQILGFGRADAVIGNRIALDRAVHGRAEKRSLVGVAGIDRALGHAHVGGDRLDGRLLEPLVEKMVERPVEQLFVPRFGLFAGGTPGAGAGGQLVHHRATAAEILYLIKRIE